MEKKEVKPIYRRQVLDEMDVRTLPDGRKRIFSIKFVTAEGKLIYFPQAYACGAGRMNNKVFRVRGVQACDCLGNPEKGIHVYPVKIYNIIQYNGHPVQ
jgi:hypothetical protein